MRRRRKSGVAGSVVELTLGSATVSAFLIDEPRAAKIRKIRKLHIYRTRNRIDKVSFPTNKTII